jgi:type IV pilus assembly protein PilE
MGAPVAPGFNTMHPSKWGATMHTNPGRSRGFTLIEMMIVVVIAGILAAIALPSYFQYIQRSKIIEATTGLSNWRTRMEQYFLDNRTYVNGCALYQGSIQAQVKAFTLSCPTETASTYTLKAVGNPGDGMDSAFVYTVDQSNVKSTVGLPSGWTTPSPNDCWATRKDGTCG